MILNKLKYLIISIAFLFHTDLKADYIISATNNLATTVTLTFRVYNASNVLLNTNTTPLAGGGGVWSLGCSAGVPAYIHVIDAGGCLLNIINLNSTGTCSTCSGCTGFPTTTSYTCSENLTSACTPVTHEITLSIDP